MNTNTSIVEAVRSMTNKELVSAVIELQLQVADLVAKQQPIRNEAQREMTDDDARRILTGDLADKKHKDAASMLNLSYGQIYSCRLEFTFKHIHKAMKDSGTPNPFKK
jgi:hypothetical protein